MRAQLRPSNGIKEDEALNPTLYFCATADTAVSLFSRRLSLLVLAVLKKCSDQSTTDLVRLSKQPTGGPTVCILKWDVAGKHCTLADLGTENRNSRETRKKLKKARRGQRISFSAMACSRRLIYLSCLTEAWGAKASWPCCRRPQYGCLLNRVRRCVCSAIESRALCIKIVAFASICAVYPSKGQLGAQGLIPSTGFEELSPKNATA